MADHCIFKRVPALETLNLKVIRFIHTDTDDALHLLHILNYVNTFKIFFEI